MRVVTEYKLYCFRHIYTSRITLQYVLLYKHRNIWKPFVHGAVSNSDLLGISLSRSEGRNTGVFQLPYSHQSYQQPLWFVSVMLQLFVGRCGRRRPLKSPTDCIGGIKVGKIRATLLATLKPLWKAVRYEPLPKYLKSISSGLLAVWECTPCRRRNVWLVLPSLGWHLREETAERRGRCWLFAAECRY